MTQESQGAEGTTQTLDELWRSDPELIRQYLDLLPDYEQLCTEIVYILTKRIKESDIQVASIPGRAKRLESFLEKCKKKGYPEPLKNITDIAGVRVICLYLSDIDRIAEIIRKEFIIIEEVNKAGKLAVDQFGYGAQHFVVKLGTNSSGARYDDLKNLICEIQVRTVLQDAWAIIQNHLVYKSESQIPTSLQRKLNRLAAQFETIDDLFENIRDKRKNYINDVRASTEVPEKFLQIELNWDSLGEYLNWKYQDRDLESRSKKLQHVFDGIKKVFRNLHELDDAITNTENRRAAVIQKLGDDIPKTENGKVPSSLEIALAALLIHPELEHDFSFNPKWVKIINRYRELPTDVKSIPKNSV